VVTVAIHAQPELVQLEHVDFDRKDCL